jgi:hypothetical protein
METPKYEIVQQVKWVLVRHGVDLSRMQFSCTKSSLYISGSLKKDPRGDFGELQVESLFNELDRLPWRLDIRADLDNWAVEYAFGSWKITKRRDSEASIQGEDG